MTFIGNGLSDMTPKAMKEKLDKLNFIKVKNLYAEDIITLPRK